MGFVRCLLLVCAMVLHICSEDGTLSGFYIYDAYFFWSVVFMNKEKKKKTQLSPYIFLIFCISICCLNMYFMDILVLNVNGREIVKCLSLIQ